MAINICKDAGTTASIASYTSQPSLTGWTGTDLYAYDENFSTARAWSANGSSSPCTCSITATFTWSSQIFRIDYVTHQMWAYANLDPAGGGGSSQYLKVEIRQSSVWNPTPIYIQTSSGGAGVSQTSNTSITNTGPWAGCDGVRFTTYCDKTTSGHGRGWNNWGSMTEAQAWGSFGVSNNQVIML